MKDIELIKHLFIRTYGSQLEGHIHDYHQILMPLMGDILFTSINKPSWCIGAYRSILVQKKKASYSTKNHSGAIFYIFGWHRY